MSDAPKVLVIDDSEVARRAICEIARAAGFEPIELASPIGATREIIRNQVGIVILDVNMPTMRGDKLAVLFRANPRFAHLRIILVSGASAAEMRPLVAEVQADGYVCKADLLEQLPRTLRAIAAQSAAAGKQAAPL